MRLLTLPLALLSQLVIIAAINTPHPLDPLTSAEIKKTVAAIKREKPGVDWAFVHIALEEPPKAQLLAYFLQNDLDSATNAHIPRKSCSFIRDLHSTVPHRVIVNLAGPGVVEAWNSDPGKFVKMSEAERLRTAAIAIADPIVQERCAKMGYSNVSLLDGTGWPIGFVGDQPQYQGRRIFKVGLAGVNFPEDNTSAHPMDFQVLVDSAENKVIAIEELPAQSSPFDDGSDKTNVMTPKTQFNYNPALLDPNFFRKDLKPVSLCQQGVSFSLNGNELSWQKWNLRLGFNGREGVTLHTVSYNGEGKVHPAFYRVSLSEMYIPYGDPRRPYHRENYFDQGDSGLGYRITTLEEGVHCIGNVQFIDAHLNNEAGEVITIPRAVCIREEDVGIGLKHKGSVTRNQRLAITCISTFSHYDYVYNWYLYQDATIQFNIQLTGALGVNLQAFGAGPTGHGLTVAPGIFAPNHQHFGLLRVDADIDGPKNTVLMNDIVSGPGQTGSPLNYYGNAFTLNTTVFRTAAEARTNINSETLRSWLVTPRWPVLPERDGISGWQLVPHPSPRAMILEDSPLFAAGGFTKYHTWVTPFREGEYFGAGLYAGQGDGLPEWVDRDPNASIENSDVVLWHSFNMPHVPRVEDWPVMSSANLNVELRPFNYFKVNPAMDVVQANVKPAVCHNVCYCPMEPSKPIGQPH